jgi:hypothetical protein
MCFVFRQHKAVADVLQCNDDDVNGIYFYLYFSEGEARRSLQSELNTEKARKVNIVKCNKHVLTRRLEYRRGTCRNTFPW